MMLRKLFAQFILVQVEQERLQELHRHLRQREQQVNRALARFGIVERDLLRQMRAVATEAEVEALAEEHNTRWDDDHEGVVFAFIPPPNAENEIAFDELDRNKIVGKKRRR